MVWGGQAAEAAGKKGGIGEHGVPTILSGSSRWSLRCHCFPDQRLACSVYNFLGGFFHFPNVGLQIKAMGTSSFILENSL